MTAFSLLIFFFVPMMLFLALGAGADVRKNLEISRQEIAAEREQRKRAETAAAEAEQRKKAEDAERDAKSKKERNQSGGSNGAAQAIDLSKKIKALYILGLEESASAQEIKLAYRRISQIHHPDKYSALGPEEVAAATETFKRINAA